MHERLSRWGEERGYRVGWGPLEVVDDALADVLSRGLPAPLLDYASESISREDAASLRARGFAGIVLVVVPRPAHRVAFAREEGTIDTLLPPTYMNYRPTFEEVREDLARKGLPGARLEVLQAPLKAVAARLGLVAYGRNNVTYAPGLGSFIQLAGYLTDAPLPLPEGWRPSAPAVLGRCLHCRACVKSCPTGAISAERFLLDATRCLTFANELEGPWPEWVSPRAHHTILGCLACQTRCPENPPLPIEPSGVVFAREETAALLSQPEPRDEPVWAGVREKLAALGQSYSEEVLGRNLRALAERAA